MIYEEFFAGFFFFVDLVEWRKDAVCTFSHIIRLRRRDVLIGSRGKRLVNRRVR
jgi:hypothetical protein